MPPSHSQARLLRPAGQLRAWTGFLVDWFVMDVLWVVPASIQAGLEALVEIDALAEGPQLQVAQD